VSNLFDLRRGEAALQDGNKTALYSNILDTCSGMRKKLADLQSGRLKRAESTFRDPNYPKKQLRVIMTLEDGRLRTTYWMDDTNIWAHCQQKRKDFDEYRRHAALQTTDNMFREYFMSSWLLETYILLKYGIDLRSSEWADPSNSDFKKVNWIIDNDPFAARYKLTTYCESLGMPNPFNEIRVDMAGLDLSGLINNSDKGSTNDHKSSTTQSQTNTNVIWTDPSTEISPERSQ
jgi:hypothetical protein